MHAANTVSYVMANDDESFKEEMMRQLGMAWHVVTKQEGQCCLIGQQGYGILLIAYWLIFGLKWEP
jgi:hypothetical protein